MFSWTYRAEGRELLPTKSGPGSFLRSPRHPLPCRPRPISPWLRLGRGQVKPQRKPPLSPSTPVLPVDTSLGLERQVYLRGTASGPRCSPAAQLSEPDSPSQVLLPRQGRKMPQ